MKSTSSTLIPLVFLLTGCGFNQVQAQHNTPIPQSLALAAERASQGTLAMADMMARSHGQSVRDVALEVPDSHVPDFLLQRVRLDYNGPMDQVLKRVSTDIGYRVTEYNEPSSGRSWEPWIRLSGDKPLVQHFKEMNSQTPWHLVLDHINRRIVVDYDADGSMAKQVQRTQQALNSNRSSDRVQLPDTSSMRENADRQISNNVIPAPTGPSQQASTAPERAAPMPISATKNVMPASGRGYWYAGIKGYQSEARANDMRQWLGANDFIALVTSRDGQFEVHVPAVDDSQAAMFTDELSALGVPSSVNYQSNGSRGSVQTASPTYKSSPTATTHSFSTQSPNVASQRQDALLENMWYVQIAYIGKLADAEKLQTNNKLQQPLDSYKLGRGYAVRYGPYDNRNEAISVLRDARSAGYTDAYPVRGRNT